MLIVVIVIGLLYALPNLFGEDPAVQITGARGVAASEQLLSLWHWKRALFLRASTPLTPNCALVKH